MSYSNQNWELFEEWPAFKAEIIRRIRTLEQLTEYLKRRQHELGYNEDEMDTEYIETPLGMIDKGTWMYFWDGEVGSSVEDLIYYTKLEGYDPLSEEPYLTEMMDFRNASLTPPEWAKND